MKVKMGSEAHKELFCRQFLETHGIDGDYAGDCPQSAVCVETAQLSMTLHAYAAPRGGVIHDVRNSALKGSRECGSRTSEAEIGEIGK